MKDTQEELLERLHRINEEIAAVNGLGSGIAGVEGAIALFQIANAAGAYPAVISRGGTLLSCNLLFTQLTGWTEEEVLGKGPADIVAPEDRVRVQDLVTSRSTLSYVASITGKDGSSIPVMVHPRYVGAFRVSAIETLGHPARRRTDAASRSDG